MTAKTHVWDGLLPDIDNENSAITRSFFLTRGLSRNIRSFCAHRGAIHTPVFTLLFFLPAYFAGGRYLRALLAGIGAECLSHLILDSFNKSGAMCFCPFFRKKFHLARIRGF